MCKAREGLDVLQHAQASAEEAADSHAAQQPADAAPGGKARSCGSEVDSVAAAVQAWSKAVPLLACPVLPDMQLELVAAHGEAAAVAAAAVADAAVAVATVAAAAAAGMAAAAADDIEGRLVADAAAAADDNEGEPVAAVAGISVAAVLCPTQQHMHHDLPGSSYHAPASVPRSHPHAFDQHCQPEVAQRLHTAQDSAWYGEHSLAHCLGPCACLCTAFSLGWSRPHLVPCIAAERCWLACC